MSHRMRLALSAAGLFGLLQSTSAADLPVKAPPPIPPAPYNWSGFYIGANIGYSWGRASSDHRTTFPFGTFTLGSDTTNVDGVVGGGQLGFNWQTGSFVFGVEADIQASGQEGSSTFICPSTVEVCAPPVSVTAPHTEKLTWFGTVRGRIGYAFDRWMIYGTGGFAYGTIESDTARIVVEPEPPIRSASFNNSSTRTGWTVGAGVEGALAANWIWRVEYLYMDLGTVNFSNVLPAPPFFPGVTASQSIRFTDNIVRVGLNYRF